MDEDMQALRQTVKVSYPNNSGVSGAAFLSKEIKF